MPRSRTQRTFAPPVVEAMRWNDGVTHPPDRPLLNVSQAAPADPPPARLRAHLAELVMSDDGAHLYGPVLGLPALREALAARVATLYGGAVPPDHVAITAGCNQAFAATIAALCGEGDAVILPAPWYFNHKMWLDMQGVTATALQTGDDLLPDPDHARALITDRTRAIALVSPNNPGGVEYPPALLRAFAELARDTGLRLILDETYRDFHARPGAPHDLLTDADWDAVLVQLYSFSKSYRLTGHRVGAITAAPELLAQAERFLDTVTICPPQIGQRAALWGLQNLDRWLAGERAEILARRAAIEAGFPALAERGWRLLGLGAYFAWLEHPFDTGADDLCRTLVREASVLALPASMFRPGGDARAGRELRVAFANVDTAGIATLFERLAGLGFARRRT